MKENFSSRLTALRESRNWTKSFVAERLGISPQRYSNYEYGKREPEFDILKSIATLFNVSLDYLLGQDDNKTVYETDLDKLIDNAHSYDGKPITGRDRDVIKAFLKGLYTNN